MRKLSLFFFAASGLVSVIAIAEACGGTADDTATTAPDAGVEAATPAETGAQDAGAKDAAKESAAPCDTSEDFLADVPRDASLADGQTTSGACIDCLQASCKSSLDACNVDCNCREVVSGALDCYSKGGDIVKCVFASKVQPTQKTQGIGASIVQCMQRSCDQACAFSTFVSDAGDAATD